MCQNYRQIEEETKWLEKKSKSAITCGEMLIWELQIKTADQSCEPTAISSFLKRNVMNITSHSCKYAQMNKPQWTANQQTQTEASTSKWTAGSKKKDYLSGFQQLLLQHRWEREQKRKEEKKNRQVVSRQDVSRELYSTGNQKRIHNF